MIWTSKSGSFADPAKGSHGLPGAVRISKASALILVALIFAIVAHPSDRLQAAGRDRRASYVT
jgi:hypothetical protein